MRSCAQRQFMCLYKAPVGQMRFFFPRPERPRGAVVCARLEDDDIVPRGRRRGRRHNRQSTLLAVIGRRRVSSGRPKKIQPWAHDWWRRGDASRWNMQCPVPSDVPTGLEQQTRAAAGLAPRHKARNREAAARRLSHGAALRVRHLTVVVPPPTNLDHPMRGAVAHAWKISGARRAGHCASLCRAAVYRVDR